MRPDVLSCNIGVLGNGHGVLGCYDGVLGLCKAALCYFSGVLVELMSVLFLSGLVLRETCNP